MACLPRPLTGLASKTLFRSFPRIGSNLRPSLTTRSFQHRRMAESTATSVAKPGTLTSEQFVDLLSSKTPIERADIRCLHVTAYPFPIWNSEEQWSYTTYYFSHLLPLFPGLTLDCLEVDDPFHGPDVMEDGWGHDATYDILRDMIKRSKGWKELVYNVKGEEWLQDVVFKKHTVQGDREVEEFHGRDSQPESWDKMIKERVGSDSGAKVEMWVKHSEDKKEWEKFEGQYQASGEEDTSAVQEAEIPEADVSVVSSDARYGDNDKTRPIFQVKVRGGDNAQYSQDGEKPNDDFVKPLYDLFNEKSWAQIKESVFHKGGEQDPACHL